MAVPGDISGKERDPLYVFALEVPYRGERKKIETM